MEELHEKLWRATKAGFARKMQWAEFKLRCANGERLEVVEDYDQPGEDNSNSFGRQPQTGSNPDYNDKGDGAITMRTLMPAKWLQIQPGNFPGSRSRHPT